MGDKIFSPIILDIGFKTILKYILITKKNWEKGNMGIDKIIRIVALLAAVVLAFVATGQNALILAVVGLVLGALAVEADHRKLFLIALIALNVVQASLSSIPVVGVYLTDILGNMSAVANAAGVVVIFMMIKDRIMS